MGDDLTVAETAAALGTSPQTVRTLLRNGELGGRKRVEKGHDVWDVSRASLDAFLVEYGRLDGRRRRRMPVPVPVPIPVPAGAGVVSGPGSMLLPPVDSAPPPPSEPAPPFPDLEEVDERPFVLRPRGRATVVTVVLGVPLLAVYVAARILPGALWFQELDQLDVFVRAAVARVEFYVLVTGVVAVVVGANLAVACRRTAAIGTRKGILGVVAAAIVTGTMFASAAAGHWETFVLWRHRQPFGVVDPIHGKDVGFFVFSLPFELWISTTLFWLVAVTAVYVAIVARARGMLTLRPPRVAFEAQVHLAALAAAFWLVLAWRFWLGRYALELGQPSIQGGSFAGAGYVDAHVRSPGLGALAFLAVVLAAASLAAPFLVRAGRRRHARVFLGVPAALLLLAVVLVAALVPALVQRFVVDPSPLLREQPYLARSIAATRIGLGLDQVDAQPYSPRQAFSAADFPSVRKRLGDVAVWDTSLLGARMRQIVTDTPYYSPGDPSADITGVHGRRQLTAVSARELDLASVDRGAATWVNDRVAYTHGLGLVRFSATDIAPDRQPRLLDAGQGLHEPRIYFGNLPQARVEGEEPGVLTATTNRQIANSPWVLVDTRRPEVDIPASDSAPRASYHYDGSGGIELSNWPRRAMFALTLGSKELLLSDDITPDTRILLHRDVHDRLENLAPFIQWDSQAVPLTEDGRVVYLVDGYTTSNHYPYAERADLGASRVNYARASVRATVDAFSGKVNLYLTDPSEPIARAWSEAFPSLFRPADDMPAELRDRLRYPGDLFDAQATAYERYHATRPELFVSDADAWSRPIALSGPIEVASNVNFDEDDEDDLRLTLQPAYSFAAPPGRTMPRLVLNTYFSPRSGQNLVSSLSGWVDAHGRARLSARNLSRDPVTLGPAQISRKVFATARVRNLLGLRNLEIRDLDKSSLDSVILGQPHLLFLPSGIMQIQSLYEGSRGPGAARLLGVTAFVNGRAGLGPTTRSAVRQALNEPPDVDVLPPAEPAVVGTPVRLDFHVENARSETVTVTSSAGRRTTHHQVTTGRGTLVWRPSAPGDARVRIRVVGLDGTRVVDGTAFHVLDAAPTIRLVGAPNHAVVGRPVRLSFRVENGVRARAKVSTRSGIVFNRRYLIRHGAGSIAWTPRAPGPARLLVRASGHQGQAATATLRLVIDPRPVAPATPTVEVLHVPEEAMAGQAARFAFRADGCRVAVARIEGPELDTRVWRFPCPVHRGSFTWTPPSPGGYRLSVIARGEEGQTTIARSPLVVAPDPAAPTPPTIDLLRSPDTATVGRATELELGADGCRVAVARIEGRGGDASDARPRVWRFACPDPHATFSWTPTRTGRYLLTAVARGGGTQARAATRLDAERP